jgi:hypothetical protein
MHNLKPIEGYCRAQNVSGTWEVNFCFPTTGAQTKIYYLRREEIQIS